MKRGFLFIISTLLIISLQAQESLNMKRMALLDGMGIEYNDIWGYQHGAKEYAVIGSNTAINIVDVTDCANPILENQWIDGSNVVWRDFKEYKDYIYAVCDGGACGEGLQIINKNDFTHTQSTSVFTRAHNIYIDKEEGRLYVVGTNTSYHGMFVYDIKTDPANPVLLKNVKFKDILNDQDGTYYVHDVYVKDNIAYCSHGYQGYMIWDVADLNNISRIGHEEEGLGGYNHSSWKHPSEPYVYVAEETHGKEIAIYDISDINEPFITHTFKDPLLDNVDNVLAHNPFVYLNRLYISYYHDGVKVYDVSQADTATLIGYYDTYPENNNYSSYHGAWGIYPYLPSGCIVAADIEHGLSTLKMTIKPEASTRSQASDIVIDDMSKGLVFVTPDDVYVRLSLDTSGELQSSNIAGAPSSKLEVINSNLKFENATTGIIMKNSLGKYFRLTVNDLGELITSSVQLPANSVMVGGEDVFFSQYRGGLILKNNIGECYHITVGDLEQIEINLIECD